MKADDGMVQVKYGAVQSPPVIGGGQGGRGGGGESAVLRRPVKEKTGERGKVVWQRAEEWGAGSGRWPHGRRGGGGGPTLRWAAPCRVNRGARRAAPFLIKKLL
jgi:hypothetical protein